MDRIDVFIWLFPILFIFHDFEEIIFMEAWIKKNKSFLKSKFPKLSQKLLLHFENITTQTFALGVAEEFIIISLVTISAFITNWYSLWIGLFVAFTLHLVIHIIQGVVIGRYIPAIVTSIICLPICIYIISLILKLFPLSAIALYSVLGFILMVVNLGIVHKGMDLFSKWTTKR